MGVGRCEPLKVATVTRHHHATACLDRGGDAVGIDEGARVCVGRRKDAADETSEVSICFSNFETCLAAEASIDHLVQPRPPIQLGQHHRGHHDIASKSTSGFQRSPDLGEALSLRACKAGQCL